MSAEPIATRRPLVTAFRAGVLTGLATFVLVVTAFFAFADWLEGPEPPFDIEVLTAGADISHAGGSRVVIENNAAGALLTARCDGVCDDLAYRALTADADSVQYRVRVLNDAAGCVACGGYDFVHDTYGRAHMAQWRIAGQGGLNTRPTHFAYGRDGTFRLSSKAAAAVD